MSRTYEEGLRDGMLEKANEDLINVCSRIAVLESDLDGARKTKWELVNKIKLLESGVSLDCFDAGEALTLFDKIEKIKSTAVLS